MASVIVIDDEESVRYSLRAILEEAGHTVVEAGNGSDGLMLMAETAVDVAIVDMIMPVKEGVETTIQIQRQFPSVKTIAMSGGGRNQNSDFLQIARDSGACGTLQKPFSKEQLLTSIESCMVGDGG